MFLKNLTRKSTQSFLGQIEHLKDALIEADAVVIGAGSGLSASAGFTYSGERFEKYFSDFHLKYGISDIYSGGFYPYSTLEEYWAWWSRHIWVNRYVDIPKDTYKTLLALVQDKDYFVLTTNVDHCFQKSDFDKRRLFYTQGDYGLWQCSKPCHQTTYDNEETVRKMLLAQGFQIAESNDLILPEGTKPVMQIPTELVPHCPICGAPMTMNLRCDDTFVEDTGWHKASERYHDFIRRHENLRVLFLELGVGANTPVIIKYPFWRMTEKNPKATYACINYGEALCPNEIKEQSLCMDADIEDVLKNISSRFIYCKNGQNYL